MRVCPDASVAFPLFRFPSSQQRIPTLASPDSVDFTMEIFPAKELPSLT